MAISAHAETANPRDGRFLRAGSRRREVADTGAVMGMLGKYAFFKKIIPGKYATKERMAINLRQKKFAFLQFSAF